MQKLLGIALRIDRLSEAAGTLVSWLSLLMVIAAAFNAVARYAGKFFGATLSSNAFIEAQWYMFSLVFLLGAAYTLKRDEHVRVDVLYGRLSPRGKAWVDLVGTLVLMLPFCAMAFSVSLPSVLHSIEVGEGSPDPGGLPRYPLKAAVLVVFALLFLQGISIVIKRIAFLRGIAVPEDAPKDAP